MQSVVFFNKDDTYEERKRYLDNLSEAVRSSKDYTPEEDDEDDIEHGSCISIEEMMRFRRETGLEVFLTSIYKPNSINTAFRSIFDVIQGRQESIRSEQAEEMMTPEENQHGMEKPVND